MLKIIFKFCLIFLISFNFFKVLALENCNWDNSGTPCLTISKTSNTSSYNSGNINKKFLIDNKLKQQVHKTLLIFLN